MSVVIHITCLRAKEKTVKSRNSRSQQKLSNAVAKIEFLEGRAYLTGVVFQTPGISTSASSAGISPNFATLQDFNGDSKADLVVANGNNTVSVLLSNGDGTFQIAGERPGGCFAKPLAGRIKSMPAAPFDIVTGNTGTVSVILGNGNGTFGAATNVTALSSNDAIGTGDLNGDGRTDIVVVNKSQSAAANDRVGILFQNLDGTFTLANAQRESRTRGWVQLLSPISMATLLKTSHWSTSWTIK